MITIMSYGQLIKIPMDKIDLLLDQYTWKVVELWKSIQISQEFSFTLVIIYQHGKIQVLLEKMEWYMNNMEDFVLKHKFIQMLLTKQRILG